MSSWLGTFLIQQLQPALVATDFEKFHFELSTTVENHTWKLEAIGQM